MIWYATMLYVRIWYCYDLIRTMSCFLFGQRNDEENLRVVFERVLHPSAMPAERARLVWERFVQLELCLSRTGGSLIKAQDVENRMDQVSTSCAVDVTCE